MCCPVFGVTKLTIPEQASIGAVLPREERRPRRRRERRRRVVRLFASHPTVTRTCTRRLRVITLHYISRPPTMRREPLGAAHRIAVDGICVIIIIIIVS